MEPSAVLTGDVIGSTALAARGGLPALLEDAFAAVERAGSVLRRFEIYRGDGFQGVVRTEKALLAATIVRARLRSHQVDGEDDARLDARIAIGVGRIEHELERVVVSDGEAFQRSGRALDLLARAKDGRRLRVETGDADEDGGPDLAAQLLDAIVGRWSRPAAEAMFLALTDATATQAQIAETLRVSQPAISQRLKSARLAEVRKILALYERSVAAPSAS